MSQNFKETAREQLEFYWGKTLKEAANDQMNQKSFALPLARIKRLMKVEEDVKMVANEVPVLFAKVAEKFVEELTLRAWLNTDENKRRILQKNDLAAATKTSDIFDFLIYIIPRDGFMDYETRNDGFNVPLKMHDWYGEEKFDFRKYGDDYKDDYDRYDVKRYDDRMLGEREYREPPHDPRSYGSYDDHRNRDY